MATTEHVNRGDELEEGEVPDAPAVALEVNTTNGKIHPKEDDSTDHASNPTSSSPNSHSNAHSSQKSEKTEKEKKDKKSHDRSKEKEKSREKEKRHKDKDKHKDKSRDREREKDRDRGDRDRGRDGNRDKERDKDRRDKDRERERDRDRVRDRERDRDREKDRNRDRERDRDRDRDRDYKDREKDRDQDRAKDRERDSAKDRVEKDDKRGNKRDTPEKPKESKEDATKLPGDKTEMKKSRREVPQVPDEEMEDVPTLEEEEEKLIQQSRLRRQQILAKYKQPSPPAEVPEQPQPEATAETVPDTSLQSQTMDLAKQDTEKDVSSSDDEGGAQKPQEPDGTAAVLAKSPVFDMFSDSPLDDAHLKGEKNQLVIPNDIPEDVELRDDSEGYYCFQMGEVMNGRYKVISASGKGVFSDVVKAIDLSNPSQTVAIKILRNKDIIKKAGLNEINILGMINTADHDNKKHCIRLLGHFEDKSHLCLVFEPMDINLRELLTKYGKNVGISIKAVKIYTQKLLLALLQLKRLKLIHADIKLDNILVDDTRRVIKLADFGTASPVTDNPPAPYVVSRFYRAPEIILGFRYEYGIDMWSIACCLYELFTGRLLFPGVNNNDMLRLFMEAKGPFPKKMIRKAPAMFRDKYFDDSFRFKQEERDKGGQQFIKIIGNVQKTRDLKAELLSCCRAEDKASVEHLHDLVEKMLNLDPQKRISVEEALRHPFVRS